MGVSYLKLRVVWFNMMYELGKNCEENFTIREKYRDLICRHIFVPESLTHHPNGEGQVFFCPLVTIWGMQLRQGMPPSPSGVCKLELAEDYAWATVSKSENFSFVYPVFCCGNDAHLLHTIIYSFWWLFTSNSPSRNVELRCVCLLWSLNPLLDLETFPQMLQECESPAMWFASMCSFMCPLFASFPHTLQENAALCLFRFLSDGHSPP